LGIRFPASGRSDQNSASGQFGLLHNQHRLQKNRGTTREENSKYTHSGEDMAKKKKPKRFSAVEAVKAMAREQIGSPPVEQVVPNRKKKPERHKSTLGKLLGESE
jgi:hypothetical protein